MVTITPFPPYDQTSHPYDSPAYPLSWPVKTINERHVKDVRKGIMITFEDGTWEFIAIDDDCFQKIKKAIES